MTDQTVQKIGAEEIAWNLSDLYAGVDDPQINTDLEQAHELADQLAETHKGRIGDLSVSEMVSFITLYEQILDQSRRLGMYAQMHWTTDTADPERGALMARITEEGSRIQQKLLFIELEWANASDEQAEKIINAPELARFKHWLETSRLMRPYLLTEPEEKILTEKSTTGKQAWSRFFNEVHGANRYNYDGEEVPSQIVLNKLYDTNREIRQNAAEAMTEGLQKISHISTFVFNQILADKASNDRLRDFPTWVSSRNLSNEVDDDSVQALIEAVTSRYDIVARYYNLKKRLLGYDELYDYDRYAPLPTADRVYSWDQGKTLVLESFESFHPKLSEVAAKFFDNNWIDAPVRPNKRGGAYAMPGPPSLHPYVFMNFQGQPRDVETLAHELGHGIHMYLSQGQSILEAYTPLTTAETASVFGEAIVFDRLLAKEDDPAVKLAMLNSKLEGSFATVFRQVAMNRFEHEIHTYRREEGELSTAKFSEIWMETQKDMFIGSVTMSENYGIWWSYIPHFIGSPGYVYAYAFGELLVLALYARYQESQNGFADLYIDMLSQGGSNWPHEIVKPLGVDFTDPSFWQTGLQILDDQVTEAEALAEQVQN